MLHFTGLTFCVGLTGCTVLFGENGLDVVLKNSHSEPHTVSTTMNGFEETASLNPNTSQKFKNVLPYPESPTEKKKTITVKMDGNPVDTYKFTFSRELKTLIIIVTDDEKISYGRITSAPPIANNRSSMR